MKFFDPLFSEIKAPGRLKTAVRAVAFALMSAQILTGIFWMICNWGVMVPYGDVCEYIRLAHTLVLDTWRPVAYPLFVRLAMTIAHPLGVPFYTVIHTLQCLISFTAIYYTLQTFWYCFGNGISRLPALSKETVLGSPARRKLLFLTAFIFTNPLILHFNLSVLTDSLCNSFSLLFVANILIIMKGDRWQWGHIGFGILTFILMCLLRAERLMLMGGLVLLLVLLLLFKLKGPGRKRVMLSILLVIVIAIPVTTAIKDFSQTANVGRLPPSIHTALFQRIVYKHTADNYDAMPDSVKAVLTREDAVYNDKWQLNTNTTCAKILKKDPDHYDQILDAMWQTVLIHDFGRVAKSVFRDFSWNVFSPEIFNVCTVHTVATTDLTWNRLRYGTPGPALVYMTVAEMTFWFLLILLGGATLQNHRYLTDYNLLWGGLVTFMILQSLLYAGTSNYGFHIRYQLFNYSLQIMTGVFVLAVGPRRPEQGAPQH